MKGTLFVASLLFVSVCFAASRPLPFDPERVKTMSREELINLVLESHGQEAKPKSVSKEPWLASPQIWPHPEKFESGNQDVIVNPALTFKISNTSSDIVDALERFQSRTFQHRISSAVESNAEAISFLDIDVLESLAPIQLEVDESYTLEIRSNIKILANTQVGVYHALETLSQLIRFNFEKQAYIIANTPWIIDDAPRFKHRELLVDSSRHFLPPRTLKSILESMTYAKVNVLHWHIVDEQAFPFSSTSRPNLALKGSYSPFERYSIEDVEDVIEFARKRGIRVVVEVDQPGHARSWCAGYPEICPSSTCLEPLNPMKNVTFEVIEDVLRDMTGGVREKGLFFDNFLHLGGDEVDTSCWSETKEIADWMKEKNMTADDTYFEFVDRAQKIGRSMGRDVVGWEEIWNAFGTKLDKSTIVQVWLDAATTKSIVEAGYRALFSPSHQWYFANLHNNWAEMYTVEPCQGIDDAVCERYLLGGGGEMWGETVDVSDIQNTVWPRLAAVAERLWSPRSVQDVKNAESRILSFRCLLNERGIASAPVRNAAARTSPPSPGSCYEQ